MLRFLGSSLSLQHWGMVWSSALGTGQQLGIAQESVTFPFVEHWELVLLVLPPQLRGVLHWQMPDKERTLNLQSKRLSTKASRLAKSHSEIRERTFELICHPKRESSSLVKVLQTMLDHWRFFAVPTESHCLFTTPTSCFSFSVESLTLCCEVPMYCFQNLEEHNVSRNETTPPSPPATSWMVLFTVARESFLCPPCCSWKTFRTILETK